MAVIKAVEAAKDNQEKKVFNFMDIAADAKEQIAHSHEEAKLEGHKKGHEQGLNEGRKKGHEQGLEEARKDFAKNSSSALKVLKDALQEYDQMKTKLLWQAEQGAVELVVKICEKVIKRSVEKNPDMTVDNLKGALDMVTQRCNLIVKVNPADMDHLKEMVDNDEAVFGKYENINIEADKEVSTGGCRVLTENGEIDAQLDTQLNKIAEELVMTNV